MLNLWLTDGQKSSVANYDNNRKKHELWYQEDGKTKSSEVFYEDGQKLREVIYDKNGNIKNNSLKASANDHQTNQPKTNSGNTQKPSVLSALKDNAEHVTEQNNSIPSHTIMNESNNR